MKEVLVQRGRIRARIQAPGIAVDLNIAESASSLREIRRLVETVQARQGEMLFEDPVGWQFSEELRSSPAAMDFIKQASRAEPCTLYRKLSFDNLRVVDTFKKEFFATLDTQRTRQQVVSQLSDIDGDARFGLVHIIGTVSKDDKALLVDALRKRFSQAELKTQFTHKDVLGKTVVELILFGKFQQEQY
ncbi:hypothetical protein HY492_03220 [Candidatus Woesearchaeota archaeon]|nr:hypothetical protein [Candidatus Woesearchaeota archaeon]